MRALQSENHTTPMIAGEKITDGIDIGTWTVKAGQKYVTFSVWDFAGQTVYYNTHQVTQY